MPPRFLLATLATAMIAPAFAAPLPDPAELPPSATPPDPLVMRDGSRITIREGWQEQRAPELRALFQHYEYGTMPPAVKVDAKLVREDKQALGGKATLREITLTLAQPEGAQISLLLVV